jgi:hypothetical protein
MVSLANLPRPDNKAQDDFNYLHAFYNYYPTTTLTLDFFLALFIQRFNFHANISFTPQIFIYQDIVGDGNCGFEIIRQSLNNAPIHFPNQAPVPSTNVAKAIHAIRTHLASLYTIEEMENDIAEFFSQSPFVLQAFPYALLRLYAKAGFAEARGTGSGARLRSGELILQQFQTLNRQRPPIIVSRSDFVALVDSPHYYCDERMLKYASATFHINYRIFNRRTCSFQFHHPASYPCPHAHTVFLLLNEGRSMDSHFDVLAKRVRNGTTVLLTDSDIPPSVRHICCMDV